MLTVLALYSGTDIYVNSIDPNEMVHNELHNLSFCFWFVTKTTICPNSRIKSPLHKFRDEMDKLKRTVISQGKFPIAEADS